MNGSDSAPGDPVLYGRQRERAILDRLLAGARAGRSGVLVVRGEPGIGKTALLDYLVRSASDLRVVRSTGVESERELAFAALHQLCAPMLDRREHLPGPQRDALAVALGLQEGPVPDQFFVGLAVLGMFSDLAQRRPLVCVVDDAQWLDKASANTLAFIARRLLAESVVMVFAAREPGEELSGLPELVLEGLPDAGARELLASVIRLPLDERVRAQVVAETRGNPLALIELPRGLSPNQLAGGFGLARAQAVPARVEESFRDRLGALPDDTRQLLLLAAADPTGDAALLWRAAEGLEIETSAAVAAEADGLLKIETRVQFRHPLVRSAVYRSASLQERRAAHRTLARVTDCELDPDRRAWHLAAAAAGADEEVASALERSAERARARGGVAATAAFLQRSVALTAEPGARSERALAAAQASLQAGTLDAAAELLDLATAGPMDELQQARADALRGQLAFASSAGRDAPALLVKAAKQMEPLDPALAREIYLDAWIAAMVAGQLVGAGDLHEVSRAARAAPPPTGAPRPSDVLLDALAALVIDGRAEAGPLLRRAARLFAEGEITAEERVRWAAPATAAAVMVWDEERWHTIVARELQSCREAGVLAQLVISASSTATHALCRGEFVLAAALIAEAEAIAAATGTQFAPYPAMLLAGFRGAEAELVPLMESVMKDARAVGQGVAVQASQWAAAILYNGLGRYESALAEAAQAVEQAPELFVSMLVVPELIEAAIRTGQAQQAATALERLVEDTNVGESDWGLGLLARSRALCAAREDAEGAYREAIDRLSRTQLRPEVARAHLLYGEWLRREARRVDARAQLRAAHHQFTSMGMEGFAERARRELSATGERARKRTPQTRDELTPQEAQIARLAREGVSNAEIAARLYISRRTVEYHLRKVFTKLGISSRHQLDRALPPEATSGVLS